MTELPEEPEELAAPEERWQVQMELQEPTAAGAEGQDILVPRLLEELEARAQRLKAAAAVVVEAIRQVPAATELIMGEAEAEAAIFLRSEGPEGAMREAEAAHMLEMQELEETSAAAADQALVLA